MDATMGFITRKKTPFLGIIFCGTFSRHLKQIQDHWSDKKVAKTTRGRPVCFGGPASQPPFSKWCFFFLYWMRNLSLQKRNGETRKLPGWWLFLLRSTKKVNSTMMFFSPFFFCDVFSHQLPKFFFKRLKIKDSNADALNRFECVCFSFSIIRSLLTNHLVT